MAEAVKAEADVPEFARSTMDGYAVRARDTFGAGPGNPAWLTVAGEVGMGEAARLPLEAGQVQRIATGGMLPPGADAVVMVEYTQELADQTLEIYRSVAPLENVVQRGEDVLAGSTLRPAGLRLRPQDVGLLAALGVTRSVRCAGVPGWPLSPPAMRSCPWRRLCNPARCGMPTPMPWRPRWLPWVVNPFFWA